MLTKEESDALERFLEEAYDSDFHKVATPEICAIIGKALGYISEQHESTLKQFGRARGRLG